MKLGLAYITQIRGVEDRPGGEDRPAADAPGEATPGVLSVLRGFLALQLTNLVATIGAGYHTEHNLDDTHKTITASGSISEHGRRTPLGEWIPLPFSTLAFVGLGTMTWTVSPTLATIKYMVVGKTVFLVFNIGLTTVAAPLNTQLILRLPTDFFQAVTLTRVAIRLSDNGVLVPGEAVVDPAQNPRSIFFIRQDAANFAAAAGTTSINGEMFYEVA